MPLVKIERVRFATDASMALITNQSTSAFRAALGDLIAALIAGSPSVIAAAEVAARAAVATALADWGITDVQDGEFVVKDSRERLAIKVNRDGSTNIPEPILAGNRVRKAAGFAIVDEKQRTAFRVNPDGSVLIPNLIGRGGGGGGGEGGAGNQILKVVLLVMLGQSNGEGRARPFGPRLDPQNTSIRMYDWNQQDLALATVPLSSPQQQVGLSPVTQIARRFVAESPNTVTVVLNAAAGGSGLVTDPAQGCWKVGYTGSNPALYSQALAALSRTRTLIQEQYGLTPEVWFYWHQGESDSSISEASYAAALDDLIAGFRSAIGDSTAPFTVGGMVPERIASNTGLEKIRAAHMATPVRNQYAAYADGIAGGGGSADPDDIVHYHRAGALALGDAMYEASLRAATASSTQVPHKPLDVDARLVGGDLVVSWSAPDTRYTSFVVEYRVGGGAWTSRTTTTAALTTTFTGVSGSTVEVRVSTRNGTTVTPPTIPVLAH